MKAKILMLIALFMNFSFMACAGTPKQKIAKNDWNQPDSVIASQLGTSLKEVLFSPKKVNCYHLLQKQNIAENEIQPVKSYVRDTLLTAFSKEQTAVLQYLLLDNEKSYSEDIISIEAPYRPVLEFEFIGAKNRKASVVVSLSDHSWGIMYDGKEQFKYNYADVRLFEKFCNYFIKKYHPKKQ